MDSGTYKHGRYSKFLPAGVRRDYERALHDPALLSIEHDIALVDAHLADQLGHVEAAGAGARAMTRLRECMVAMSEAAGVGNALGFDRAYREAVRIVDGRLGQAMLWDDIIGKLESRRKLVESERKRQLEIKTTMTAEQATLFVGAVFQVVEQHVKDPYVLERVFSDYTRILGGRPIAPGGGTPAGADSIEIEPGRIS